VRLLLDECVTRKLKREIIGHEVLTVGELGWEGTKNGMLLRRAADAGFDAMLTVDRSLPYQQNTADLPVAVIVLRSVKSNLSHLRKLIPEMAALLSDLEPGRLYWVGPSA
jgi:hypothetical protein